MGKLSVSSLGGFCNSRRAQAEVAMAPPPVPVVAGADRDDGAAAEQRRGEAERKDAFHGGILLSRFDRGRVPVLRWRA